MKKVQDVEMKIGAKVLQERAARKLQPQGGILVLAEMFYLCS